MKRSLLLSRLFSWSFDRHYLKEHNADYEVCNDWACRLLWAIENILWWGGRGEEGMNE